MCVLINYTENFQVFRIHILRQHKYETTSERISTVSELEKECKFPTASDEQGTCQTYKTCFTE